MNEQSPEPRRKPGPVPGPERRQFTILIDPDLGDWGKQQPGGLSEMVRRLLKQARLPAPAHGAVSPLASSTSIGSEQGHTPRRVNQSTLDRAAQSCHALSNDLDTMGQTAARAGAISLAESLLELQGRASMTLRDLVDAGAADPTDASGG